jgi:hypothetical protein
MAEVVAAPRSVGHQITIIQFNFNMSSLPRPGRIEVKTLVAHLVTSIPKGLSYSSDHHPVALLSPSEQKMASGLGQNTDITVVLGEPIDQNPSSQFEVVKQYNPRGEWTLHRLASSTSFMCGRCNREKKAKLVATRNNRWDDICCNACYGHLLSRER